MLSCAVYSIKVLYDSITRYNLYDCRILFNSHTDIIEQ